MKRHYGRVADSGVGMIVLEASSIAEAFTSPHTLRAFGRENVPGLSKLAATLKKHGAMAIIQLCHAGRYTCAPGCLAPSAVPPFGDASLMPKAMDEEDMKRIAAAFAAAAVIAREAGFDGVELHGGTGYLLSSFISPRTNIRTDRYGGTLENRARFPLEVARSVRNAVKDFPIGYRLLSAELVDGGLQEEEAAAFAALPKEAVQPAYISPAVGTHECLAAPGANRWAEGGMLKAAEIVKKALKRTPVIGAGHLQDPAYCEAVLKDGRVDAIGLGRVLFTDLQWPLKARRGETVSNCTQCDGCLRRIMKYHPAFCVRWEKEIRQEYNDTRA